jgi:Fe-S cluster assembly ATP-binding protein
MFEIKNLNVTVEDKDIIKNLCLTIKPKEVHVIMGKNGIGKSSLLNSIIGNTKYIKSGSIQLNGNELINHSITDIAKSGVFMSFQNPPEIKGVSNYGLVREILKENAGPSTLVEYKRHIGELELQSDWGSRSLNYNASGGEKKKNELIQLMMIKPKIALLDEIDSGCDVGIIKVIANKIMYMREQGTAFIIVSHYYHFINMLKPTAVHLLDGTIVRSGDMRLAMELNENGYE